jgi:hypothetical protein
VVIDNNNMANSYFSAGYAVGWEASFQFNYYWIYGPFSTSDWAGVSYNADIGKGFIAGGGSANAGHLTDTEYFPLSYTTAKVSYGPAFGLGCGNRSVTVLGNINVVDIIPFYPPTPW